MFSSKTSPFTFLSNLFRAQKEVLLRLETLDVGQSSENQSLNNIETLKSQSDTVMPSAPPLYPEIPLPSTKTNEVSKTNQVNGHHETKNAIQKDESSMNDTWQDVKELLKIEEGICCNFYLFYVLNCILRIYN